MTSTSQNQLLSLFQAPRARLWLPSFAAVAIGDPVAGRALAPFLGPETESIEGGRRARVPGEEHFLRTWAVIRPGFLGEGSSDYAEHTRKDHRRTKIPANLIAMPIQWIQVMLGSVAISNGQPRLLPVIWEAGRRFARDIEADEAIVRQPYGKAKSAMLKYFAEVDIIPEQRMAYWAALDRGIVRRDLGGTRGRVDVDMVRASFRRHALPARFVRQFAPPKS